MPKLNNAINFVRRQPRWRLVLAVLVVVVLGGWWWKSGGKSDSTALTFAASRASLPRSASGLTSDIRQSADYRSQLCA